MIGDKTDFTQNPRAAVLSVTPARKIGCLCGINVIVPPLTAAAW
jgi:hypothetical protein